VHIARAWIALMKRLGYTRFVAQGGDWGAQITDVMGAQAPPELAGIHTNMAGTLPPEISKAVASGAPAPAGLSAEESRAYEQLSFLYTKGIGYATEMSLRPQTLYGLADSPIGLAAWMLDHDARSYEDIARAFVDDQPVGNLTRDEVLDNITLTWLTNTGTSSGRLYWEYTLGSFDVKSVTVPDASLMNVFERHVHMPSLDGATEWLGSQPLGPDELRGHVVLVNFWTLTCINWLRQEPYVRAWSRAYRDDGLIVIGAHTPEFS